MTAPPPADLAFEDYLTIVRQRWTWFAAPIAALLVIAVVFGLTASPRYTSTASVLIADSVAQELLDPRSQNAGLLTRRIENEINFAESDATERLVTDELGELPPIEITGIDTADVLEFTATASDPATAARHANAWADAYVTAKQQAAEASIDQAVTRLQERLEDLQDQRSEARAPIDELQDQLVLVTSDSERASIRARIDRLTDDLAPSLQLIDARIAQVVSSVDDLELNKEVAGAGTAQVLQVAAPPTSESGTPLWQLLGVAIALGAALGVALALVAERVDTTIRTPDDVLDATGLGVLGSIPKAGKELDGIELALVGRDLPESAVADGYRRATSAFQFWAIGTETRSVLVTSADQGEGKTTSATNFAYALAMLDQDVVLVDVDFRRPRLHKVMGLPSEPGLTNHLVDGASLRDLAWPVDDNRPMALITCGRSDHDNPAELIAMPEFGAALDVMAAEADIVVLDGPPLLPVADAVLLARRVDAVVLTAAVGKTKKAHLKRAVDGITQVGGSVIGIVLIGAKESEIYGDYGYSYGADAEKRSRFKRRPRDLSLATSTIDLSDS